MTRSFLDLLTPESKRTGVRLARHSPRMWIRQWLDGLFRGKSHERIDDLDHTFFFHMLKPQEDDPHLAEFSFALCLMVTSFF